MQGVFSPSFKEASLSGVSYIKFKLDSVETMGWSENQTTPSSRLYTVSTSGGQRHTVFGPSDVKQMVNYLSFGWDTERPPKPDLTVRDPSVTHTGFRLNTDTISENQSPDFPGWEARPTGPSLPVDDVLTPAAAAQTGTSFSNLDDNLFTQ